MEMGGERREGIFEDGRDKQTLYNREERPRRRVAEGCVVKGVSSVSGGSD